MSSTLVSPREQDLEREVAELTERLAYANDVIEQRNAMVSRLHAEVEALRNQEPAGYFLQDGDRFVEVSYSVKHYPGVTKLYLAAGAKDST